MTCVLHQGDCLEVMRGLAGGSVDAVVTDPPAGIAFMGKEWDNFPLRDRGKLADREHGRGFANGITFDKSRAGREGFIEFLTPRLAEARRLSKPGAYMLCWALPRTSHWTGLAVEDAGWVVRDRIAHLFGSGFPKSKACLKPACEDWWLAWNPCKKVTPLNIDQCRIPKADGDTSGWSISGSKASLNVAMSGANTAREPKPDHSLGRWPSNVTHDGSDEVLEAFAAYGESKSPPVGSMGGGSNRHSIYGDFSGKRHGNGHGDSGSAARFFYSSKASKRDRTECCEDVEASHPTVKNTRLMRWLCRLITPLDGVVLDPFMGSGSTGVACEAEGFSFIGIEQSAEYYALADGRLIRKAGWLY